jgi:hypothetical protein
MCVHFTSLLHENGSSIVACVFISAGIFSPSRCVKINVGSGSIITAFRRHVTIVKDTTLRKLDLFLPQVRRLVILTLLGPLEKADYSRDWGRFFNGLRMDVSNPSSEDRNRSVFRKVVFFLILNYGQS